MNKKKRDQEAGFTLLEMLIVLSLWSILILLVVPMHTGQVEKQQEHGFLETLEFDLLYIQKLATMTKDHVKIVFKQDQYIIVKGTDESEINTRKIPPGWRVTMNTLKNISFNQKGKIRQPGSIRIYTKRSVYDVIFPFGKGRGYIVEN